MTLTPYKPNQGVHLRGGAGVALMLLSLFGCARLYQMLQGGDAFSLLGMPVSSSAFIWAGAVFVTLACIIAVLTFGLQTGWERLDAKTRRFVDLLVDTQGELQKVSWPGRDKLRRFTTVVLVCILVLGVFLTIVDLIFTQLMEWLGVLPGSQ